MGLEAKRFMDAGGLVPDEVVIGIVRDRLAETDCESGFILDGFPRTVGQARALDQFASLQAVVNIVVPEEQVVSRLSGRRTCKACGAIFHVVNSPPSVSGTCDQCGGELYQRSDDNETSIRARLAEYREKTAPLESYYGELGVLHEVDGTGDLDDVETRVLQALR
jgi:adenylate kinase